MGPTPYPFGSGRVAFGSCASRNRQRRGGSRSAPRAAPHHVLRGLAGRPSPAAGLLHGGRATPPSAPDSNAKGVVPTRPLPAPPAGRTRERAATDYERGPGRALPRKRHGAPGGQALIRTPLVVGCERPQQAVKAPDHIHDEPLLDRLLHRVEVERVVDWVCGFSRPNISSVRPFGVAVKAKYDRFDWCPLRAPTDRASASFTTSISTESRPASSTSAAVSSCSSPAQSASRRSNAPSRADRALATAALSWARALLPTKPGLTAFERVTPQPSARYGTVHRCELLDADANVLAWWHTRGTSLRVGEVVALRGLVERYTRFGPTAVTVLNHCRREALGSGNFPADIKASARRPVT
jgi:hypothetical protein